MFQDFLNDRYCIYLLAPTARNVYNMATYFFRLEAKTFPILGRHSYFQFYIQLVLIATLPFIHPKAWCGIATLKPKFIYLYYQLFSADAASLKNSNSGFFAHENMKKQFSLCIALAAQTLKSMCSLMWIIDQLQIKLGFDAVLLAL